MADVAAASGLTRQTVYHQFSSKLALLDACIDRALDDGTDTAVRTLPEYRAMAEGDLDARLTAGAAWLRRAHERSARIQNVLDQAAVTDTSARERLREREQTRRDEVRHALTLVLGRHPDDATVDSVWVLASRRTYLMLVDGRGWPPERWETWFRELTRAAVSSADLGP